MRGLIYSSSVLIASPALAASGPFVSLRNTDFIVLLAFIAFIGVLVYFKVPSLIGGMLDKRANTIRNELDEARNYVKKLKVSLQAMSGVRKKSKSKRHGSLKARVKRLKLKLKKHEQPLTSR